MDVDEAREFYEHKIISHVHAKMYAAIEETFIPERALTCKLTFKTSFGMHFRSQRAMLML